MFSPVKQFLRDSEEYYNLGLRYDTLPLWPGTSFETYDFLESACKLFIKEEQIKSSPSP